MENRDWQQEYERILEEAKKGGRVQILPNHAEKRRHPRFRLKTGKVLVTEQIPHDVVDLSVSGLAFYSDRPFAVGAAIMMSLHQVVAIQAEVMGCDALSGPDAPAPYKVRCQFQDADYGLRFLVVAMEMERGS